MGLSRLGAVDIRASIHLDLYHQRMLQNVTYRHYAEISITTEGQLVINELVQAVGQHQQIALVVEAKGIRPAQDSIVFGDDLGLM